MNVRLGVLSSGIIIAAMLAVSAWAWGQLPPDAQVPVHWGLDGQPDRYGGKAEALLVVPAVTLLVTTLLAFVPRIEPRRAHLEQSAAAYVTVWNAVVLVLAAVHGVIVASGLGYHVNIGAVMTGALGLLFMVMGRVLGDVRSNFFFGVRTPWTLSSERSWEQTHRLAARLFLVLGLVVVVLAFTSSPAVQFVALLGGGLAVAVTLVVYSYYAWKTDPDRQQAGQ